jgi:hypothetical protein
MIEKLHTINSVRGDPGYKLLLIVSYHFVRKAESEPIRDAYYSTLLAVSPEWTVVDIENISSIRIITYGTCWVFFATF